MDNIQPIVRFCRLKERQWRDPTFGKYVRERVYTDERGQLELEIVYSSRPIPEEQPK